MNQLHENLYKLLIELDDICKENGIEYCLAGGSALGALRNHCFLPWDDDIDLYITRDNWNKLKALVESDKNIFSNNRKMVYVENAPYHRNPIIRFVNADTTVVYSAQAFSGETCGQQVEFFVLDPIPDDEKERIKFIKLHKAYLELLSPFFVVNKNASIGEFKKHYRLYNKYYWKSKIFGHQKVLRDLEKKLFSYDEKDCKDYCLRWGIRVLLHKKEFYQGKRTERLETRDFPVAYKLEQAMRVDYGDSWMYIPQGSGQISHNPIIEDLDRPFETYTNIYLPKINREKAIKNYAKNKHNNMKLFVLRRKIEASESKIRALIRENQYEKTLSGKTEELRNMLDNRKYAELNEVFANFYATQAVARRKNILVDIGDENLYIAIMNQIMQGKYFAVDAVLRVRENHERPLTKDLLECRKIITMCKELSVAVYDFKDVLKVKEVMAKYPEYEEYLDMYRSLLWIKEKEATSADEYKEIISIGNEALKMYSFDGELMAFVAEALLNLGEKEKATELYDEAIHNTRNGLVWNKAKESVGLDRMLEE